MANILNHIPPPGIGLNLVAVGLLLEKLFDFINKNESFFVYTFAQELLKQEKTIFIFIIYMCEYYVFSTFGLAFLESVISETLFFIFLL